MPTISRFFGIVILMYYDEHAPPHFHARYSGREAMFRIDPPGLSQGDLPPKAVARILEWARVHRRELLADWDLARRQLPLKSIPPLR